MPRTKRRPENLTDWRAIENEREKYAAYLCSREWGVLKEAVHKRSGGTCERCGILPGNAVHHLTYERKYREEIEDLQHNCHACHDFTHGKSKYDPIGEYPGPLHPDQVIYAHRWTGYVRRCFGKYGRQEPVLDYWAVVGWIDEMISDAVYRNCQFLAVVLLKDLVEGHSASVYFESCEVGSENETTYRVLEVYELAIETLCFNLDGIPKDTALWIRLRCPECPEDLYDESIRQVRKCL